MGNVKGVELREVTPSDVDRIYGWVIKPWYEMNLLEMLFRRRKPIGHILIMYSSREPAILQWNTTVCTLDAQGSNTSRTDTVRVGGISETNP